MTLVSTKAYVALDELGSSGNTKGRKEGGRLDIRRQIKDVNFVASLTDSTLKAYESAPFLPDAIITADKRINDNISLSLGYDAGVKGAFASVTGDANISNKDLRGTATWFQKGNHIRTEASANLDGRSSLWGTYTFRDNANLTNSTYINLREREGFILRPFLVPVATNAVKYNFTKSEYQLEASADLNRRTFYVSAQKRHRKQTYKAHYAIKEEYAMLEIGHSQNETNLPFVKGYFKGPLGPDGVGPLSVGLIFDKAFDL